MSNETIRVLVVDDNPLDRDLARRLLTRYSRVTFDVTTVSSGTEFLAALPKGGFDLVLLDYNLPGENGVALLREARKADDAPPIIMLTGSGDERVAVEAIQAGAYDYFPKASITSQILAQSIHQALERYRLDAQLESTEKVIFTLAAAVEAKDPTTKDHIERMSTVAPRLGAALGLDVTQQKLLHYGAILHDIGKVGVSEAVLRKKGPLTPEEWQDIYQHPITGETICAPLRFATQVNPIIRHHHERWDGKGYVDGLAGEEIPLLARIMAVVDSFDAMSETRPYRDGLPREEVCRRLDEGAGSQWDPNIIEVFLHMLEEEHHALADAAHSAA